VDVYFFKFVWTYCIDWIFFNISRGQMLQ